jgi:hypothetical protein
MNGASSSARLTVITSDFKRMSLAARCQCWSLSLLAHCGHVINRLVEMTSRKIPRNDAQELSENSEDENISELEQAVQKMMGYSKAPTCP